MKKYIVVISLLCLTFILPAQQQLTHQKRRYTAPDGKLYVNKDLPVYLFLSVTPNLNDGVALESKSTADYANPFYFDTEGLNTIKTPYCVDPETRLTVQPPRDVVFEVYADGIAPTTSSSFTGAPRYVSGGTIYYGKGLQVTLTPRDAVSGVEQTLYSLNGTAYQKYTNTLSMNKEGNQVLKYYAADNVGNFAEPSSRSYVVDLSAPVSTYSTTQPKKGDILSPKASISLASTDNLAGVQVVRYAFDNATDRSYSSRLSLGWLSDGDHTLYYYAKDNVSNEETRKAYTFYLDKTPPVVSYEILGDQYKGTCMYVSNRTKIKLSATDNKAGVENIYYLIDGTGKTIYGNEFLIPDRKGSHTITYYAIDQVTNQAGNRYFTVCMDNTPPVTSISYGKPQFFTRDTLFVTSATPVTLTARDYDSGIKSTSKKDNSAGGLYSSPFTLPGEGMHTIRFNSTDMVNNVEKEKESEAYVDNTAPVIYVNFSIKAIGEHKKGGNTLNVYPNYTRLYIGATDSKVGTARIQYSLNGAEFVDYSSPYTLDVSELNKFQNKKIYTVVIRATDKLGNKSEKTVEFYVGKE